jgi:DHA1 family multidrug resistance protein-like MFS transporter
MPRSASQTIAGRVGLPAAELSVFVRGPAARLALLVLALSTVAFLRVALLPAIGHDLVLRPGLISSVTVAFGVGRLVADLPAGDVADRISPLRALGGASGGLALGSLLLAGAHSLAALLVAAAVLGVASSATNTTGMTYFSRGTATHRGKRLAIFSAALLGGQALGPAVSGVVSGEAGWRATEGVAAALAALIALVCLFGRRDGSSPSRQPERAGGTRAPRPIDPVQRALLYLVSFSVFGALGALPQTLLPLIGSDRYRLSAGVIGLLLGVGGACRFAGAAVGGVVADRVSRKAALVPALLTMAAGTALLELPGGPAVWAASVVLLSLGSFGITIAATMLADLGGGVRVGRRLGAFRLAGDAGVIVWPLAAGWLYDTLGTRFAIGVVGSLLAATALVAALALAETRTVDAAAAL